MKTEKEIIIKLKKHIKEYEKTVTNRNVRFEALTQSCVMSFLFGWEKGYQRALEWVLSV